MSAIGETASTAVRDDDGLAAALRDLEARCSAQVDAAQAVEARSAPSQLRHVSTTSPHATPSRNGEDPFGRVYHESAQSGAVPKGAVDSQRSAQGEVSQSSAAHAPPPCHVQVRVGVPAIYEELQGQVPASAWASEYGGLSEPLPQLPDDGIVVKLQVRVCAATRICHSLAASHMA